MASDTDLWMNLKAAQAKYQSKLDASKENTSVDTIDDMELVVNQVDMPSLCEYQESELAKTSHRSQATPPDKRQLNQEEFDRYKVNFIMTIIIYIFCNLQQKCNQFLKLHDLDFQKVQGQKGSFLWQRPVSINCVVFVACIRQKSSQVPAISKIET